MYVKQTAYIKQGICLNSNLTYLQRFCFRIFAHKNNYPAMSKALNLTWVADCYEEAMQIVVVFVLGRYF